METRGRMLTEGLVAGLIGYAAIAFFYAMVNLATGQPVFATARFLGTRLVDPEVAAAVPMAPVLAFNGLHLLVLLLVGLAGSFLVYETEHHPGLWLLTAFVGAVGLVLLEVGFLILAPGPAALPGWSLVGANALAALGMGAFFGMAHSSLAQHVGHREAHG